MLSLPRLGREKSLIHPAALARHAWTRALIDSHCPACCPTTFVEVTSHCRVLLLARLARTRPLIDSHCRAHCQSTFVDVTSHCRALLLARLARTRALIDSHCRAHCPTTFVDVISHCRALLRSHARQCDDHSQNLYKYRRDKASTPQDTPQKHAATQHNHHIAARCCPQDRPTSHGTR